MLGIESGGSIWSGSISLWRLKKKKKKKKNSRPPPQRNPTGTRLIRPLSMPSIGIHGGNTPCSRFSILKKRHGLSILSISPVWELPHNDARPVHPPRHAAFLVPRVYLPRRATHCASGHADWRSIRDQIPATCSATDAVMQAIPRPAPGFGKAAQTLVERRHAGQVMQNALVDAQGARGQASPGSTSIRRQ